MATADHGIRLASGAYERLQAEARRHRAIEETAGEMRNERLPQPIADREPAHAALDRLAALSADVRHGIDASCRAVEGLLYGITGDDHFGLPATVTL